MQWRVTVEGAPCRFLVFGSLVLGERELDHRGRVAIDAAAGRISFRPDPDSLWGRAYPDAVYDLVTDTPAEIAAMGGDVRPFVPAVVAEALEWTDMAELATRPVDALSGGQRQRVAIARSLLADSSLLLLDDALSAVDTGTETRILEHLAELRASRPELTAIIASHRLSAVVNADLIVVLKDGRVVESGDHETLLLRDGWYASQWRYQQLEASIDAS